MRAPPLKPNKSSFIIQFQRSKGINETKQSHVSEINCRKLRVLLFLLIIHADELQQRLRRGKKIRADNLWQQMNSRLWLSTLLIVRVFFTLWNDCSISCGVCRKENSCINFFPRVIYENVFTWHDHVSMYVRVNEDIMCES